MDPTLIGIFLLIGLLVALAIGTPIYASLGLVSAIGIFMLRGVSGLDVMPAILFDKISNFVFLAVPLFILMGETIAITGLGGELFTLFYRWFGHLPGGLAIASTGACAVFGAMCGVSTAGAATIGVVSVPEMLKRGYDKKLATGAVAAAGALAILIPPSVPFILYGSITGTSVGRLFIAGIVPGVILALMMMVYVGLLAWWRPTLAPPSKEAVSWKSRFAALSRTWTSLVLIIVVLGSIYAGIGTPTEAAAFGALGSLLLALVVYRSLNWRTFVNILVQSVVTTGFVMWVVGGAMLFGYIMTALRVPQDFAALVVGLHLPTYALYMAVIVVLIIGGMFLDVGSLILLTTPLLLPMMMATGADPLWYGVILVIACEMALITPPVAVNVFVIHGISAPFGVSLTEIYLGAAPYVLVELAAVVLFMVFPELILWLPSKMMG